MGEPTKFINLLKELLNKILEILAEVGIELPVIFVQVFLLVLVLTLIFLFLPKRKEWRKKPMVTLSVVALGLIASGIFFTWIQQASVEFPEEVVGTLIIDDNNLMQGYEGMYVELWDGKGRKMTVEPAYVDDNQTVYLYYQPRMGHLPKKILVKAPSCQPDSYEYPLDFDELVVGKFTRHLNCARD